MNKLLQHFTLRAWLKGIKANSKQAQRRPPASADGMIAAAIRLQQLCRRWLLIKQRFAWQEQQQDPPALSARAGKNQGPASALNRFRLCIGFCPLATPAAALDGRRFSNRHAFCCYHVFASDWPIEPLIQESGRS